MGIEAKSPYPDGNIPDYMFYDTPQRYVQQVQAQMVVLDAQYLLLLCGRRNSVIAMKQPIGFDQKLWDKSLFLADQLYGEEKPNVPTRLHPLMWELRDLGYKGLQCIPLPIHH